MGLGGYSDHVGQMICTYQGIHGDQDLHVDQYLYVMCTCQCDHVGTCDHGYQVHGYQECR